MPAGIPFIYYDDPELGRLEMNIGQPPSPDILARLPPDIQQWYQARREFQERGAVRHPGAGNWAGRPSNWLNIPLSTQPAQTQPIPTTAPTPAPQTTAHAARPSGPQFINQFQTGPAMQTKAPDFSELLRRMMAFRQPSQPKIFQPSSPQQAGGYSPFQRQSSASQSSLPTLTTPGNYNASFWNKFKL